jgi:hypothetical protein
MTRKFTSETEYKLWLQAKGDTVKVLDIKSFRRLFQPVWKDNTGYEVTFEELTSSRQ